MDTKKYETKIYQDKAFISTGPCSTYIFLTQQEAEDFCKIAVKGLKPAPGYRAWGSVSFLSSDYFSVRLFQCTEFDGESVEY